MTLSKPKVLFIDDEENILNSLKRLFHKGEITCFFTSNPEEAIRLLVDEKIWVIISDQRMPIMEGAEVLRRAREAAPDSVRIMLTGYADIKSAMKAVNAGNIFRFLVKPWNEDELRGAIQEGISQYQLVEENKRLTLLTKRQNSELMQFNQDLENTVEERTREIRALHGEIKKSFYTCVKLMGALPGIFDKSLDGQSYRVARAAGFIAKNLGLSESDIFDVQIAAFLHNIGALSNLGKKAGAQVFEKDAVKISAKIVSLIPNLGKAPLFIKHLLERFDGKGFPDGLLGSKIPLGSRIVAVCSAFDRMLYLGTFKRATPQNVLRELEAGANSEFDPRIIRLLEVYVDRFLVSADEQFEMSLGLVQLQAGMVVSRSLLNKRGEVLVSKDTTLTDDILELLWQRQMNEQAVGEVYIYVSSAVDSTRAA